MFYSDKMIITHRKSEITTNKWNGTNCSTYTIWIEGVKHPGLDSAQTVVVEEMRSCSLRWKEHEVQIYKLVVWAGNWTND